MLLVCTNISKVILVWLPSSGWSEQKNDLARFFLRVSRRGKRLRTLVTNSKTSFIFASLNFLQ